MFYTLFKLIDSSCSNVVKDVSLRITRRLMLIAEVFTIMKFAFLSYFRNYNVNDVIPED